MRLTEIRISLLHIRRKPHVVLQNDLCHDELDLIGCEEPTRASMLSKTEACILFGHAHELILLSVFESVGVRKILLCTEVVEPVSVKGVGILVVFRIMEYGEIRSINEHTGWDSSSILKNQRLLDVPLEGV